MVGKKSLTALCCASALLLSGAGTAFAADDGIPFEKLLEVTVPNQAAVDKVTTNYDAAEYKRVESDGIVLNVFATAEEEATLKAAGYKIGATIEDSNTGPQRMAERQATIDAENLAKQVAEDGVSGSKFEGKSVVPTPGDTVIQRANTFTDVVGPSGTTTTARFLYVEAFNKSTKITGSSAVSGPALALSYAGADGVYGTAVDMSRFIDTDPTPDAYMYHRQLIRLPAGVTDVKTIRIATAATAGGAAASTETYKVTEWLGKDLPPHVAGFKNQPFFTKYMDPTENRANLDALAAQYPELMSVVDMPEKTSGYQRKSQATMNGTGAIGSAGQSSVGPLFVDTTGEITAAAPVATIPFTGTAGQSIRATVDGIPGGSTDYILTLKDPAGKVLQSIDTGTSPEVVNQSLPTAGTYTFEVSGFEGDLGDFTFKIGPVTTSSVVLTAKDWGQSGGNDVQAEFRSQGPTANLPLNIQVNGSLVEAFLATDANGASKSTAAEVVDAINAKPQAAALLTASTYRGYLGTGIVQVRARTNLSDFLNAPKSVARGPFQQHLYRIGTHRDGTKPGVFLFCQQHAREWATGLTCLQTAHELVENYATDPQTKELLDNVEVFISPNSNPDGAHYSMYDASVQRKTMVNYCPTAGPSGPDSRSTWGVDMNRNSGEYSAFDGYFGAAIGANNCTSEVFAGPGEYSEPETRNEGWVVDTFKNIKFMNNIHSYGGYFMWAPGAYKDDGQRTTSPAPNIGIEQYFFEAGEKILKRIKDSRGTVILPQRTGPIADVLYSAAGNSADDGWYRKGIIAYSFETGADRMLNTTTGTQATAVGFQPCFGAVGTGGGQGSCPNSGTMVNEGRDEALEFAAGNYGLVESAYDYGVDTTAPATTLDADGVTQSKSPINYRFTMDNEASVIHYTTDGSTPTLSSPTYNAQRARSVGEVLTVSTPGTSTVKWLAVDIKGNVSAVQSKTFLLDTVAPTITTNIPEGAVYTQGQSVPLTFSCADEAGGSGLATTGGCVGSTASGSNLPTGTAGLQVLTITATDAVGNVTVKTVNYRVLDAVNTPGTVGGSVGPTLGLTMGTPATFGQFTPGIDATYPASMNATVVSTAGDAALSVADPSSVNTGKLMNGTFTLAQALQAQATSSGGTGSAFAPVGGSASPTALLTYTAPKSNDVVAIAFKQVIGRTEGLRTGAYSKTLTFTLSTNNP
jgi:Zinc carboxypeptidase/Chitobiase/beta-hexosaminidase C-terminal domain